MSASSQGKKKKQTLDPDSRRFYRQKQIKELEFVTKRYEENLGEPLRAVKEDVEKEWLNKVEALEEKLRMQDSYVQECERALEKERQVSALQHMCNSWHASDIILRLVGHSKRRNVPLRSLWLTSMPRYPLCEASTLTTMADFARPSQPWRSLTQTHR